MTNIRPEDNELSTLIKPKLYRSIISKISDKYSVMDQFINNLSSDIIEIGSLVDRLKDDQEKGYDVGTSLDTLTFQRETLIILYKFTI